MLAGIELNAGLGAHPRVGQEPIASSGALLLANAASVPVVIDATVNHKTVSMKRATKWSIRSVTRSQPLSAAFGGEARASGRPGREDERSSPCRGPETLAGCRPRRPVDPMQRSISRISASSGPSATWRPMAVAGATRRSPSGTPPPRGTGRRCGTRLGDRRRSGSRLPRRLPGEMAAALRGISKSISCWASCAPGPARPAPTPTRAFGFVARVAASRSAFIPVPPCVRSAITSDREQGLDGSALEPRRPRRDLCPSGGAVYRANA